MVVSGGLKQQHDLDALFRLYHRELTRVAFRRLHDQDAAADLVQDAFVRYLSADRVVAPLSPRFFLHRIVANLTLDALRRTKRRGLLLAIDDVAETIADPAPLADHLLMARQEFKLLSRALNELQPRCRAALLLNRVEGKTHAEIAAMLGVSSSMVSKYIMAALSHCMKRMLHTRRLQQK